MESDKSKGGEKGGKKGGKKGNLSVVEGGKSETPTVTEETATESEKAAGAETAAKDPEAVLAEDRALTAEEAAELLRTPVGEETLFQARALVDSVRGTPGGLEESAAFMAFSAAGYETPEQFRGALVAPLVEKGILRRGDGDRLHFVEA